MSDQATMFKVMVSRVKHGYRVEVWLPGEQEFATATGPDLWTVLRMAIPYMAAAAEPDPFADLLRKADEKDRP